MISLFPVQNKRTRHVFGVACVYGALVAASASAQSESLDRSKEAAFRVLSAIAVKVLQPIEQTGVTTESDTAADPKAIFELYRSAAENGDGEAQAKLGLMYGKGIGVARNFSAAHMWFGFAGDQGVEHAEVYRDLVAKFMEPEDLAKSQEMARTRMATGGTSTDE